MDNIPPIQVSTLQTVDEHLRGGDVGGQRDVMHITQAQQGHLVGFAGLCVDRIAEEQEQIDLIAGNAGYPKYVVTLDELASGNVNGVKIIHLADFLLSAEY